MKCGYHASHEQFAPDELLDRVMQAEDAGFQTAMCSDHFHPWSHSQGHSGFAWSWLGAALQATMMPFGVVTSSGPRYHPTVQAQAAATLSVMYPNRFWLAIGSGELLNEGITGDRWPTEIERDERLRETVNIIRDLWSGKTVTHHGLARVEKATLYTRPAQPPLLLGAAITPETAQWVGGWADGMITISQPVDEQEKVVQAFREGGGAGKPMFLKVQLSYDRDEESAFQGAWDQWRFVLAPSGVLSDLRRPEQFEAAFSTVSPEVLWTKIRISADPDRHIAWIRQDINMGFETIILHNVNRQQKQFIEDFGKHVLPSVEVEVESQST